MMDLLFPNISGGFDVWQATMGAYADQLSANGEFHAAATYYVAVNRTQEAIEMFKKQSMYKWDANWEIIKLV